MKTVAEWSNDFFFGKKIGTIAELVREVREEALEAKQNQIVELILTGKQMKGKGFWVADELVNAIRQLKEKP